MAPPAACTVFGLLILITVSHASANYSIDYSKSSRYNGKGSLESDKQERVHAAQPPPGIAPPGDLSSAGVQEDINEAKEKAKESDSEAGQVTSQDQAPQVQAPVAAEAEAGEEDKDAQAETRVSGEATQEEPNTQNGESLTTESAGDVSEQVKQEKARSAQVSEGASMDSPEENRANKESGANSGDDGLTTQDEALVQQQGAAGKMSAKEMEEHLDSLKSLKSMTEQHIQQIQEMKNKLAEESTEARQNQINSLRHKQLAAIRPHIVSMRAQLHAPEVWTEPQRASLLKTLDAINMRDNNMEEVVKSLLNEVQLIEKRAAELHLLNGTPDWLKHGDKHPEGHPSTWQCESSLECAEGYYCSEPDREMLAESMGICAKKFKGWCSSNADCFDMFYCRSDSETPYGFCSLKVPKHITEAALIPAHQAVSEPTAMPTPKAQVNDSIVEKTDEPEPEPEEKAAAPVAPPKQKEEDTAEKDTETKKENINEKAEVEAAKNVAREPTPPEGAAGDGKAEKKEGPAMEDLVEVVPLQMLSVEEYAAAPESTVVRNEVNTNSHINRVASELDLAEAPPSTVMSLRGECMQRTWKHCGFDAMNLAVNCDDPTIRDGPDYADYGEEKRLRVKVAFHVVGSEDDAEHKAEVATAINGALATLREDYKQVHVHFGGEFFYWKNKELRETVVDRNDCSDSKLSCKLTNDFVKEIHGLADKNTHSRFFENHINIFVVNFKRTELLGYSFYPWDLQDPTMTSAVVINQNVLGAKHRTLSHEMGSAMGLYHIFRGTAEVECSGCNPLTHKPDCYEREPSDITGDLVKDTLPAPRSFECAQPEGKIDACTNRPYGKVQFDNIMSYAPDSCMKSLTDQQGRRIRCWMTNGIKTRNFTQKECLIANKWTAC